MTGFSVLLIYRLFFHSPDVDASPQVPNLTPAAWASEQAIGSEHLSAPPVLSVPSPSPPVIEQPLPLPAEEKLPLCQNAPPLPAERTRRYRLTNYDAQLIANAEANPATVETASPTVNGGSSYNLRRRRSQLQSEEDELEVVCIGLDCTVVTIIWVRIYRSPVLVRHPSRLLTRRGGHGPS